VPFLIDAVEDTGANKSAIPRRLRGGDQDGATEDGLQIPDTTGKLMHLPLVLLESKVVVPDAVIPSLGRRRVVVADSLVGTPSLGDPLLESLKAAAAEEVTRG
jgi:hypothetical protein